MKRKSGTVRRKKMQAREKLGSPDVEKVHFIVAQSKFGSQHVKSKACSDQKCSPKAVSFTTTRKEPQLKNERICQRSKDKCPNLNAQV